MVIAWRSYIYVYLTTKFQLEALAVYSFFFSLKEKFRILRSKHCPVS